MPKKIPFEKNLEKLESIVKKMEAGKLTLEEGLKHFSDGIELTQQCHETLSSAKQQVELLIEKNDALISEPFNFEEDEDKDFED